MLCCLGCFGAKLPTDPPAAEPESAAPPAPAIAYAAPPRLSVASPTHPPASPSPAPQTLFQRPISKRLIRVIQSCQDELFPQLDNTLLEANIEKIYQLIEQKKRANLNFDKYKLIRPVIGTPEEPYLLMAFPEKGDRVVGKGSFKTVYFCVNLKTAERNVVAVSDNKNAESAREEFVMMQTLKKVQEVVQAKFFLQGTHHSYCVMEECSHGNLHEFLGNLTTQKRVLIPKTRLLFALDIARGCAELQAQKVIHRDLKPENIFIAETDRHFYAKLGDFGLACVENDRTKNGLLKRLKLAGTAGWHSREFAQFWQKGFYKKVEQGDDDAQEKLLRIITTKSDMDAVGFILYRLFHDKHEDLPHVEHEKLDTSLREIAKLADPKVLEPLLDVIPVEYRGILKGIFFENWDASTLARHLRFAYDSLKPAAQAAPPPVAQPPAALVTAAAPLQAAPAPAPDPRYPFGVTPMGVACGPRQDPK